MPKLEQLLNRISIMHKISIIFLGCVIIPLILQSFFFMTETERNIQERVFRQVNDTMDNVRNKIDASINDAVTLSVKYHNNNRLYQLLDREYDSDLEYLVVYQEQIQRLIEADLPFHLQVDGVRFYCDNPTLFNGGLMEQAGSSGEDFLAALTDGAPILADELFFVADLEYVRRIKDNNRKISIVRQLSYYPEYSVYRKAVQIELNSSYYNSLLAESILFDNLLLVDQDGKVLFSGNSYAQNGDYDLFAEEDGAARGKTLLKRELSDLPLTLYGYYDTSMISVEFVKSRITLFGTTSLSILIALAFIFVVGNNITKRTSEIVEKSRLIAKGGFDRLVIRNSGADELAQIENSINEMSRQLQQLIENEYQSKLLQTRLEQESTQAKLLALQGQVNPHFLFNALESIRLNALDAPPRVTAQMIKYMSKMFRYLVDWDQDVVPLQDDLDFLHEYLMIQKYRFGDEFHYSIRVTEGTSACYLPKMIIQPLVENACIHGVEAVTNEKQIDIEIFFEEDRLVLRVWDNGGGMCPDRLNELQQMLQGGEKVEGSVGLYNVYQRLLLHYRDSYSFELESGCAKGTVCTVRIPAVYVP